ncbi:MAG: hypothetical protein UW34_C0001G0007 [Parcubacteria group bacterium GW2011_GWA2_44_15]|nr:MAG: hypothetical protein UW34_C0001G0007 [Parcubacteria group bacterium GW2011_GWA2_44_15]
MFNLLPQEEQLEITKEYRLRLSAVALLFLALLGVIAIIALTPSLFLLYQKEKIAINSDTALKKEIALGNKNDFSDILKLAGKKTVALATDIQTSYFYELIENITVNKTSDIKITGVSIKRADGESRDIVITGKAKNREALLSFARVLERDKVFANVTVPVSNFAPAYDIDFSILAKTLAKTK